MAFEINDLKGIFILVLFAISTVASTNINCKGRAFHCVNSTHFMICVDLGGGVSTTIDDFVIPCPATTECHENNMFECDFPEVTTTPPLQVIGVNKPSDTSEPTLVTNSVTTATPTIDIFSVFKENITATSLPIAEDVTPVVKLEVLENIMNREGVNSGNTTKASVTSSFDSKIDIFNDKKASNNTITTSATDNIKRIEHSVDTSIPETVNTSSTDKATPVDTVTSVIGLINLISTDPSSEVSTKPSSNVLTSLDSSNDNIATTTEHYNTKEVTIHGIKIENVTHKLNIPIDIIFSEKSVVGEEVSTTPALNTLVVSNINNNIESITRAGIQMVAEENSLGNSNNSNKIVSNPTTEYVPLIKNVTDDLNPHTTTDNGLVPLGLVDLISAEPKQSTLSTNDRIVTFLGDTTETTYHFINKLKTTLSEKPVIQEIISTTPTPKTIVQNVLKSDKNNDFGEIVTVEKATETNANSTFSETTTKTNIETSTEKSFVPITIEATMLYTTEPIATSEAIINNDFLEVKQTQPSQIITTDLPKVPSDNSYQMNGKLLTNTLVHTMNTNVGKSAVYSGTDIASHKVIEPVLLLSPSTKNLFIEITTPETVQKELIANESLPLSGSSVNELFPKKDNNDTLFNNTTDAMKTDDSVTTAFNAFSSDIANSKGTDPITEKSPKIEMRTTVETETLQTEFTKHVIEAKTEKPTTNDPINGNEHTVQNVGINALFGVYTTNGPFEVTLDPGQKQIEDFLSLSGTATNPQTGFTQEIIHKATEGYTSMDHVMTQKSVTDSVSKIPELLTQPHNLEATMLSEILNADQRATSVPNVVSTTTQFPSGVKGNTSISEIDKSGNMNNNSSFVNREDDLKTIEFSTPASNKNVTEFSRTTSDTPNIADINRVSKTDLKNETSFTFLANAVRNVTYFKNITDVRATTLPHHKLLSQNNYSTTTATESVSNLSPSTEKTAAYALDTKNIDFNLPNKTVNSIETINAINGTNSLKTTFHESTEKSEKNESIKIMSVVDIVNASGNATSIEMLQPTSSTPSLSNDNIKSSDSLASSVYESAIDNVPDYNSMYVEESSTQKNPVVIMLSAQSKAMDSVLSRSRMENFPVSNINTRKDEYVSTEAPVLTTIEKHANPTTTAVDYMTEKTNYYIATETMFTHQNSAISLGTSDAATPNVTKEPVYDEVTTIRDSPFITNSTQMQTEVVMNNDIHVSTEFPRLISNILVPQSAKNKASAQTTTTESTQTIILAPMTTLEKARPNSEPDLKIPVPPQYVTPEVNHNILNSMPSLPMAGATSNQITTEPTDAAIFVETTPVETTNKTNQNVQPGIQITYSPDYVMPTVNNNVPKSMPSLRILGEVATQFTTEPTDAAVFAETANVEMIDTIHPNIQSLIKTKDILQTLMPKVNNSPPSTPSLPIVEAAASEITPELTLTTVIAQTTPLAPNKDVQSGIKTTDLPQYVTSTVNNNLPQFISSLSMTETSQTTPESTNTNLFAQSKPLTATDDTNLGVLPGIKFTYLPHYVSSTVGNNISLSKPSLPLAEDTTEPTHTTEISETKPLAAPSYSDQGTGGPGIKTSDLSQYATTTVTYFNTQSISDIKTKTLTDSLTTSDTMAETITVVGDKKSGTHFGETILSNVMFTTPIVDNVRTVKSIIDHESIVVGTTFKNEEKNMSKAYVKPVDISKAEIVNHTESNWMPDVNIDNVKIKESSVEEDDLKSLVLKSGTDFKNNALQLKDGKSIDKIQYSLATGKTDHKQAESGALNNVTQSIMVITNDNKNKTVNSSVNANIQTVDVKKYKVPVDSKNIFDSYTKNITKANNNLSLQNSTTNDELEQHLISTNHTITTEVQSHLNESDKQSNKTSTELTLNGNSVHNLNLTSTKLHASSNNSIAITVPASVFKCTNLTRGKYSDRKDCRKFYTCVGNLQPIVGTCPNNTVFSEINKQCTRNLSHCVRNNQFQCLFEGRFSDFFKDNIYYICVKNRIHGFIRYKLKCQDSYHLNKAMVKCEKNEEVSIQSGSVSETINDESKPQPKSEKIVTSDDFECEKVGKFPYAKDCSKYYECTKVKDVYRRKIKKCASDEVFDKKKKKCVESDSGEC